MNDTILQWKYTSSRYNFDGATGFTTFSMSEGITSDEKDELVQKAGFYIVPSHLSSRPEEIGGLETYPVIFSSFRLKTGRRVINRTQYIGKDYAGGRYGNFFSHALILSDSKQRWPFHPIDLWESPLFARGLTAEEIDLGHRPDPLPEISLADAQNSSSIYPWNKILLDFFGDETEGKDRRKILASLIDTLFLRQLSEKKMILCSDLSEIPIWMAALQKSLSIEEEQEIPFSTYVYSSQEATNYYLTATLPEGCDFNFKSAKIKSFFNIFHIKDDLYPAMRSVFPRLISFPSPDEGDYPGSFLPISSQEICQRAKNRKLSEKEEQTNSSVQEYIAKIDDEIKVKEFLALPANFSGIQRLTQKFYGKDAPLQTFIADIIRILEVYSQEMFHPRDEVIEIFRRWDQFESLSQCRIIRDLPRIQNFTKYLQRTIFPASQNSSDSVSITQASLQDREFLNHFIYKQYHWFIEDCWKNNGDFNAIFHSLDSVLDDNTRQELYERVTLQLKELQEKNDPNDRPELLIWFLFLSILNKNAWDFEHIRDNRAFFFTDKNRLLSVILPFIAEYCGGEFYPNKNANGSKINNRDKILGILNGEDSNEYDKYSFVDACFIQALKEKNVEDYSSQDDVTDIRKANELMISFIASLPWGQTKNNEKKEKLITCLKNIVYQNTVRDKSVIGRNDTSQSEHLQDQKAKESNSVIDEKDTKKWGKIYYKTLTKSKAFKKSLKEKSYTAPNSKIDWKEIKELVGYISFWDKNWQRCCIFCYIISILSLVLSLVILILSLKKWGINEGNSLKYSIISAVIAIIFTILGMIPYLSEDKQ